MGVAVRFFILVVWCCLGITGGYGNAWGGIQAEPTFTPQSGSLLMQRNRTLQRCGGQDRCRCRLWSRAGKSEWCTLPRRCQNQRRVWTDCLVCPVQVKQVSEERLGEIGTAVAKAVAALV